MRKIFNKFLLVQIIIYGIAFSGCDEDDVNNSSADPQEKNFTYPFAINSFWYYGTRNFISNIRPDSLKSIFNNDTIDGFGEAIFLRDTVIGVDTLRVLRNNHSDEGHTHATYELFKQTDSGLVRYASYSDGSNFGPFRSLPDLKFTFKDKSFNSLNEIFGFYINDVYNSDLNLSGDTILVFDNPPVNTIRYPVLKDVEWDFYNSDFVKIKKKYLDFENVNFPGKNYFCIKIRKQYYYENSMTPDTNLIFFDYFSKEGMVKRDLLIKDITVSNKLGQVIGYIDAKEESFLNIYLQP